jgi:hypothetical protein
MANERQHLNAGSPRGFPRDRQPFAAGRLTAHGWQVMGTERRVSGFTAGQSCQSEYMSEARAFHPLATLDPRAAEAMGTAFEAAWMALCASGERLSAQQACDARIRLARIILDGVQNGERDPARLCELALASLDAPAYPPDSPPLHPYL